MEANLKKRTSLLMWHRVPDLVMIKLKILTIELSNWTLAGD